MFFSFRFIMYFVAIILVYMMAELSGVMGEANFKLYSLYAHLNCIKIAANNGNRSTIECALRAFEMDNYGNSFVYRNGECYVCREENANCAALQTEVQVVGPCYYKGKLSFI